jgi:hypothetical protein
MANLHLCELVEFEVGSKITVYIDVAYSISLKVAGIVS